MNSRRRTFTVIYRRGGTDNGTWHKCDPVPTRDEAITQVAELNRAGYPAKYHDTDLLEAIGLPEEPHVST